jgi:hypothetical protein
MKMIRNAMVGYMQFNLILTQHFLEETESLLEHLK